MGKKRGQERIAKGETREKRTRSREEESEEDGGEKGVRNGEKKGKEKRSFSLAVPLTLCALP